MVRRGGRGDEPSDRADPGGESEDPGLRGGGDRIAAETGMIKSAAGAAAYLVEQANARKKTKMVEWHDGVVDGAGLTKTDPRLMFRKAMFAMARKQAGWCNAAGTPANTSRCTSRRSTLGRPARPSPNSASPPANRSRRSPNSPDAPTVGRTGCLPGPYVDQVRIAEYGRARPLSRATYCRRYALLALRCRQRSLPPCAAHRDQIVGASESRSTRTYGNTASRITGSTIAPEPRRGLGLGLGRGRSRCSGPGDAELRQHGQQVEVVTFEN